MGNTISSVAQLYSQHTGVLTVSLCFSAWAALTSSSCILATIAHALHSYFLFFISTVMSRALPLYPLTPFNVTHLSLFISKFTRILVRKAIFVR